MRRIFAPALLAALASVAVPAHAQTPVEIVAPIIARTLIPPHKASTPGTWLKAEVIHQDSNSIIVSEEGNERVIHTFTYADNLKDKMQNMIDRGGYQWGDKIKILYTPGQTVALKIKGKPSKSS